MKKVLLFSVLLVVSHWTYAYDRQEIAGVIDWVQVNPTGSGLGTTDGVVSIRVTPSTGTPEYLFYKLNYSYASSLISAMLSANATKVQVNVTYDKDSVLNGNRYKVETLTIVQ